MSKEILSLPAFIKEGRICFPTLEKEYSLNEVLSSDGETGGLAMIDGNHDALPIESSSLIIKLVNIQKRLTIELSNDFNEKGHIRQLPFDINQRQRFDDHEFCFTMNLELSVSKRGYCEKILPKFLLISAVITPGLALVSASISIYVKGLSIPITLMLTSVSAISTLMNFTQSGVTGRAQLVGRYLDYCTQRCNRNPFSQLEHKGLRTLTGLAVFGIWAGTMISGTISALSETEIIDKAGRDAGLEFLTSNVITLHSVCFAVFGAITVGSFSGQFANLANNKLANWLIEKSSDIQRYNFWHDVPEEQTITATRAPKVG
jgi:hypothetical protein